MLTSGVILQGRYQIIQRIGGGGMGDVYLAYDLRLGNQQVIVKENRGGDPQLFYSEAAILATLRHPNLLRVIDHFVDPPPPAGTGAQYLVMDFVAGQNLEQLVQQRGALSERDALAWLNQILDAVKYLHANRIIHRDIKPQNIIITPQGNAMLVDFGIAKVMQPGRATASAAHGVGSPGYAPLEQYTGGTDERSDIYALGATLYFMLTGTEPPPAPDRANGAPMLPIRSRNPSISANIEQVVVTAAAVMKAQRFQTVDAMQRALHASGQPRPQPVPTPPQPRQVPPSPRQPLPRPRSSSSFRINWWMVGIITVLLILCASAMFAYSALSMLTTTGTYGTPTMLPLPVLPTLILPTATPAPTPTPPLTVTPVVTATLVPGSRAGEERLIGGAPMMFVPAGNFTMGSNDGASDEKPVHTVYLDAFWIDKLEVTNALYKKCVDAGKCFGPSNESSSTRSSYYGNAAFDNYPVIYVSWDEANKYCAWAGKRLPTEAEWEKAARGTDGRIYTWGNTFDKNLLNSSEGGKGDTTAVGSYLGGASPYGVLDMTGNVWEWVADWYSDNYYASSPCNNPTGSSSGQYRVLRGGAWLNTSSYSRAAYRDSVSPSYSSGSLGFRCARSP